MISPDRLLEFYFTEPPIERCSFKATLFDYLRLTARNGPLI